MRMHVQHSLQGVRSKKIFKAVTCFCTETWDFAVSDLRIKVYERANECMHFSCKCSLVSDRTVIYCLFVGGQACFNGKPLGTNEVSSEGITHTVHAGYHYLKHPYQL